MGLSGSALPFANITSTGIALKSAFIQQTEGQPSTRDAGPAWTLPSTLPPNGTTSAQLQGSIAADAESRGVTNKANVNEPPNSEVPTQDATPNETSSAQPPANGLGGDLFAITQVSSANRRGVFLLEVPFLH